MKKDIVKIFYNIITSLSYKKKIIQRMNLDQISIEYYEITMINLNMKIKIKIYIITKEICIIRKS